MTAVDLLQLNPQHIAELKSFFKGFEFTEIEIAAQEEPCGNTFENQTFGFECTCNKLKFDGIFLGKNRMHAVFTADEDDVFYCFSYAKVGKVEERIIFKLSR
ncbi:MAG: hypothetical protein II968_02320 [Selenomonadaceae bacterium]|nr:hypothetical protein [Selenomonadaceae bacterium]